ncbi:hypothetical protein [Micromonospora sp. DT229]|uniref:hypothetical protein n=1 Tax=Micromonospora sp. DT229 TaxID=3393430 RepID=UPI003CFACCAB
MTFPLVIRVQVAPGVDPTSDPAGWTWQTVTSSVRPGISVTRGSTAEASETQPSRCSLTVDFAEGLRLRRGWGVRAQVQVAGVWHTRMTGVIDELRPRLVTVDAIDTYVVEVRASGTMHRLAKGAQLRSPLLHFLSGQSDLTAWLPLEDRAGTDQPASGVSRQPRPVATAVQWGQRDEGLPGAASVARLESPQSRIVMPAGGGDLLGVGNRFMSTASWYWSASSLGSSAVEIASIAVRSETVARLSVRANETGLSTLALDSSGATLGSLFSPWQDNAHPAERWIGIQVQLERPSLVAALVIRTRIHGVGSTTWQAFQSTFSTSGNNGGFASLTAMSGGGSSWSHMSIVNRTVDPPDTAWPASGYLGESANNRLTRACATAGVQLASVGTTGTAMGPQPQGSLLEVLRDVEDADGGILFEARDGRLAYLPRVSRYNRAVALALTYGQLAPPLAPTDDDRYTRNDWTISRPDGGSARYADEEHVARYGRYDDTTSVNISGDATLADRAAWRVHLGTVEEYRYPVLTLNLRRPATLPAIPAWLGCDVGSRMQVSEVPPAMGDGVIDQHIEGYTEVIDKFSWQVDVATSPASPWQVADADGEPRVPADGSTLAASLAPGDTVLRLASTATNGRWTESLDDMPLPLRVDGQPVTATAIFPTAADWFDRLVTGGWGTTTSGMAWTTSGGSSSDYSVTGG